MLTVNWIVSSKGYKVVLLSVTCCPSPTLAVTSDAA